MAAVVEHRAGWSEYKAALMSTKSTASGCRKAAERHKKDWTDTMGKTVPPATTAPDWTRPGHVARAAAAGGRNAYAKALPMTAAHTTPRALWPPTWAGAPYKARVRCGPRPVDARALSRGADLRDKGDHA